MFCNKEKKIVKSLTLWNWNNVIWRDFFLQKMNSVEKFDYKEL